MTNCKQCGAEVPQTKGKQAKVFCDDKCRMAFNREQRKQPTPNILTPNTSKTNSEQPTPNKCKSCGADVLPLIDICHACVDKGVTRESLGLPDIQIKSDWGNQGEPNYKKLKLERNEIIPYILWYLKKAKVSGDSSITVLGKTFNWGKKKVESVKGQVKEFRADMTK